MVSTSSRSHQAAFLLGGTMVYANTLREEELKNKVANDYFKSYDSTKIIGLH
jgi:hypothetical protein